MSARIDPWEYELCDQHGPVTVCSTTTGEESTRECIGELSEHVDQGSMWSDSSWGSGWLGADKLGKSRTSWKSNKWKGDSWGSGTWYNRKRTWEEQQDPMSSYRVMQILHE